MLDALQEEPGLKMTIVRWLAERPTLPPGVAHLICAWLEDGAAVALKEELLTTLRLSRARESLPNHLLAAVVALALRRTEAVRDRDNALWIWGGQPRLSDEHFEAVVALARREDEDRSVRTAAVQVLAQPGLSGERLEAVAAMLLEEVPWYVRDAVLGVLKVQPSLSDTHLEAVLALACRKDQDQSTRKAAWDVCTHTLTYPTRASRSQWHWSTVKTRRTALGPLR